jgi:hypothetical protein
MAEPIVEALMKLESGIDAYDSHLQTDVLVVAPVLAAMGDNPRHSEILNHLGTRANKYCRMCLVRNNILIYFSLSAMYVHVIRHVKSLLYPPFGHASLQVDKNEDPTEISEIRTRELALAQMQDIASQPTETQKANKRKKYGMKDGNPMFSLSVDFFRLVGVYVYDPLGKVQPLMDHLSAVFQDIIYPTAKCS